MARGSLNQYNASVVVTSDSCSQDSSLDTSGELVVERLRALDFAEVTKVIVKDDIEAIRQAVRLTLQDDKNALTITVGGTGLCPRDVTPEATSVLYDKLCPGISCALTVASLRYNSMAALSRLTAGLSGACLIINFPGGLKACKQCSDCISCFVEHAIQQARDDRAGIVNTHHKLNLDERSNPSAVQTGCPDEPTSSHDSIRLAQNDLAHLKIHEPVNKVEVTTPNHEKDDTCSYAIKQIQTRPLTTTSRYNLVNFEQALDILSSAARRVEYPTIEIPIDCIDAAEEALGHILSEDFTSMNMIPPFAVSTMDGYILHVPPYLKDKPVKTVTAYVAVDLDEFVRLKETSGVSQFICCQVNTGGRIPDDDVFVVPYEATEAIPTTKEKIKIYKIEPNRYIRPPGSDISKSDSMKAGTYLNPISIGLIQSMGYKKVKVFKKPSIAILSTGDELVKSEEFQAGSTSTVVDTNRPMLATLFKTKGYKVFDCGICRDDPTKILIGLKYGLAKCDILVVTGGASMGTKDYVKDVICAMGGRIHFGRVNIKPGKPVAFASIDVDGREKFIFSLPGNPVSAYITSLVLVIPFIEHSLTNHFASSSTLSVENIGDLVEVQVVDLLDKSETPYQFDGRMEFVRARLIEDEKKRSPFKVRVSLKQQSSRMLNLKDCNCLIIVDPSQKGSRFLEKQTYQALKLKN